MAPVRTILVGDDEPMIREAVSSYLESKGFRVLAAENGAAAKSAGLPDWSPTWNGFGKLNTTP